MSLQKYQNINFKKAREQGFTIVELLIVIIVIAILAALVISAYGGVTNRANATNAKASASAVQKKAVAYATDNDGNYPTLANLNSYTGITTPGVTISSSQLTSAHADGKTIQYVPDGTTGACIGYWDASLSTPAAAYKYVGDATAGTNSATPTCT